MSRDTYYYEVAPLRIIRHESSTFTYAASEPLAVGQVVTIEVGKKLLVGVVMSSVKKPNYKTKEITAIIEKTPIPEPLVKLALWLADYYTTPLATVWQTVLPRGLDKARRTRPNQVHTTKRDRTIFVFNIDQGQAITDIMDSTDGTIILQGVTGSGKTEVYKEITRRMVAAGTSVIVLVPEISLTSQIISEFLHDFPDIIVTHSHMTEAQRHTVWKQVLDAKTPQVIIGPRSALFMPVPNLGAVIIDEAHEPSYKQDQSPRYSAIRAASVIGKYADAKVILGSATPSITDRFLAEATKRPIIRLDRPARSDAKAAEVTVVDMTKRQHFTRHRFISDRLIESIEKNLINGKQTLIFHNRRGSAATTLCENCGWTALCPNCFVPLTLHADTYDLSCHICGHHEKVPTSCPICHSADIIHKGIGTKLIETELQKLFPTSRIARFDSDNKTDETVNSLYEDLYQGTIDIAIGTQVVAKGLDLPQLRSVGVIQADSGLSLPDYGASERAFQLLAQVIGRVGRDEHASEVVVQTYQPTHPAIQYGLKQDYESFYTYALEMRKKSYFPPYSYLLKLTTIYKTEQAAIRAAKKLATKLKNTLNPEVRLLGPTPAFYERQHGTYRWQLILKSPKREYLVAALAQLPATHWQSELDPPSLL
ncbi:MAG: primosomal protein N' [Candidatus Microsaccharimonas sossegonensis]|uniref:Replication restart protein PriA n=1 Tax=Candidatus Microsaccharimonas sossegonensis TaxID=2506948 RepID=A0A4Q0AHP6_9BACT|nr:MAG: primosomal protein N' [Candidatus Microsaccharimonas sossegonensis]